MAQLSRRQLIGSVAAGAALASVAGLPGCAGAKPMPTLKNAQFYGPDGKFNDAAAKDAYYAMMERFGYPIPPRLRTADFWAIDFGLGKFTEVGMAGIFWVNDKDGKYFGHEIYLLPNQMLPEHAHVALPDVAPKMEAWHLRYGAVTLFGEGEKTPGAELLVPASERQYVTVWHTAQPGLGEIGKLNRAEAKHFMIASPAGAIVSEYASYHDNKALRFTNPAIKFG